MGMFNYKGQRPEWKDRTERERIVSRGENTIVLEELSLPDGIYFLQLFAEGAAQSIPNCCF